LMVSNCDLNTINETAIITVERRLVPRREQVSGFSDTQGTKSHKNLLFLTSIISPQRLKNFP
jgi:hypothetical protein